MPLKYRQMFEPESSTYTFIVFDPATMEGVLIDPVDLTVERDLQVAERMGVKLSHALNTHVHADHITGTYKLREKAGIKSVLSESAKPAVADEYLPHGGTIKVGTGHIECRFTPGHTDGCCTYVLDDKSAAFTGDALLIDGCGRTDFQQGSAETLYKSVHEQIFSLPEECMLYPGHDYRGRTATTVKEEKMYNSRLTKSLDEFKTIMENLGLPYPKKIDASLPANLRDGKPE
jgi:sulfur dioxygenase